VSDVEVSPSHRVVYTARAGYVGEDSFTYARKGLDTRNAPVTMTVRGRRADAALTRVMTGTAARLLLCRL